MNEVKRITADELVDRCRRQGLAYPLAVTSPLTKLEERAQDSFLQSYEDRPHG